MKKFCVLAVFATLALFVGCSKSIDEGVTVEPAKAELSIGLPIGISRTTMDDEGHAEWVEGDTFTLWAENRTGGFDINGADFTMMYYWHSLQSAVFTSYANALKEENYTYFAVSPKPQSINNRRATFTLPAEQTGSTIDGAYDVMVATPVTTEALSAEKVNNLALEFNHKTHLLKLTIPRNGNPLNNPIKQVVFTFPTVVTGAITLDATAPTAVPTISNGSKQLIVNIPEGFNEGEHAWARIAEGTISGAVTYYAVSTIGERTSTRTFNISKMCEGGHITPLSLTIPDPIPPTTLRFVVGNNNLGEAVQAVSIYDYNGTLLKSFWANSSNTYDIVQYGLYEEGKFQTYAGQTFTVRFESANAIVEQKVKIPSVINKYTTNTLPAVDVPYLFFEDFTSLHTEFSKDDERVDNLRSANGMLLNSYMSVSGWNGAHVKGVPGQSVRVNVRHQSTAGATRTNGRLDTPAMKGLKSGANVTLKVVFDMGAYVNSGYGSENEMFCMAGTHTQSESSTLNGKETTTVAGTEINDYSRIPGMFGSHCLTTGYLPSNYNNNSFGSTFPTYSFTASGCTSATRICWIPCCVQTTWFTAGNAHYYIYLDNIKVSIVQ
ncbi:MAG: fimbrillin family protein [Alistipes sp.]|nr:fimbrillin family protein [Alistipes sp.]